MFRLLKYFYKPALTQNVHFIRLKSEVTAGVLIIGDEILKGTDDLNSSFLVKELNKINVRVLKVAVVPDSVEAISKEINDLKSKCTYIFTSGGVGPTHDDVTYEAIAKALNQPVEVNKELFDFLVNYFGPDFKSNPGILKYSKIPKSANVQYVEFLIDSRTIKYPLVSSQNIYIFPGVPHLMRKCFNAIKSKFIQDPKIFTKEVFINLDEFNVVKILNEAVKLFKNVSFGSYPTFSNNYYKIKLVLESRSLDNIQDAFSYLSSELPDSSLVKIQSDILSRATENVYSLQATFPPLTEALSVIENAIEKYALSELCVCFNGGKDCTALLHLIYACIQKNKPNEWSKVNYLYIKNGEGFDEVDNFIKGSVERYSLNITVLEGEMKHSITQYLENHGNIKAMFLGTRKGDPGSHTLKPFSVTDPDWPSVVRILPIINWSYADVWYFIRTLQLPYCILYDHGYTSLGLKSKTVQNPSLLKKDTKGFTSYNPAYTLVDDESERKSRL